MCCSTIVQHCLIYSVYALLIQFSGWQCSCFITTTATGLHSLLYCVSFTDQDSIQYHPVEALLSMFASQPHLYHCNSEGEESFQYWDVAEVTGRQ